MTGSRLHWMTYREFGIFDDSTSAELIWIRNEALKLAQEARETLALHGVVLEESRVETGIAHSYSGTELRLALAFASQEDLAMARLLLDPQQ